jgi:hypothetical protein
VTQSLLPSPTATETPAALNQEENPINWFLVLALAGVGAAVIFVISAQKSKSHLNH